MSTSKRQRQKAGRQARLEAARIAQQKARRNRTIRNVAILVAFVLIAAFLIAILGGKDSNVATNGTTTTSSDESTSSTTPATPAVFTYGTGACAAADGTSPATLTFSDAPMQCIDPANTYAAVVHTSEGDVTFGLDTTVTPGTTNNFVTLARYHYYDNTELFRTDTSIGVIQGGSPHTNSPSDPGPGYNIPDEGGVFDFSDQSAPHGPFTYSAGDLVMARSSGPASSSAQFFFAVDDNVKNLDSQGTYLKFGHVTAGLEVLQAILALNVDDPSSGLGGHPSRTVTVTSIEIQESPAS